MSLVEAVQNKKWAKVRVLLDSGDLEVNEKDMVREDHPFF
jgi:hypothetical protein